MERRTVGRAAFAGAMDLLREVSYERRALLAKHRAEGKLTWVDRREFRRVDGLAYRIAAWLGRNLHYAPTPKSAVKESGGLSDG